MEVITIIAYKRKTPDGCISIKGRSGWIDFDFEWMGSSGTFAASRMAFLLYVRSLISWKRLVDRNDEPWCCNVEYKDKEECNLDEEA